jgi:PleD family two-component response regulator
MEVQPRMSDQSSDQPGRVLIVDRSEESRDVFRTVLERRGVEIYEAREARQGLEILRRLRPDVVVLDLEADAADDAAIQAAYGNELASHNAEMVVLGNLRRAGLFDDTHLVRKPYHYGPLIRKIEQLVEHSARLRHASTAVNTRP